MLFDSELICQFLCIITTTTQFCKYNVIFSILIPILNVSFNRFDTSVFHRLILIFEKKYSVQ